MIGQRSFVRPIGPEETWSVTINTEATASGEKMTGIPFNLTGQSDVRLYVDWGDGTSSDLTENDYAVDNSTASVHEYDTAGIYTIDITSRDWKNVFYLTILTEDSPASTSNNGIAPLYWWRRSLVSVDNAIPPINGHKSYSNPTTITSFTTAPKSRRGLFRYCDKLTTITSSLFNKSAHCTSLFRCFDHCYSLASSLDGLLDNLINLSDAAYLFNYCYAITSIPDGLFDACLNIARVQSAFRYTGISAIPSDLFAINTAITSLVDIFRNCSSLGDFELHIGSPNVTNASNFVTSSSGTTRTVYVPDNSTTKTTFDAVASSLGLTIIGE